MNIKILEQLRASIFFEHCFHKGRNVEDKVALNRISPWPLKGQNLVPITHTVEKVPNMGINCPENTENQV